MGVMEVNFMFSCFNVIALSTNPCLPGYYGLKCDGCSNGTFKSEISNKQCIPCSNKPFYSNYINNKGNSSLCPFECSLSFKKRYNP